MVLQLFALRLPEEDPTQDELEGWLGFVDEEFRAKIKRYRLVRDSLRSLGGRLCVLWHLLTTGIISSPAEAQFGIGPKGKPKLLRPICDPVVEYNVSHDGDYVLLGVQRAGRVGVDLMRISQDPDHIDLVSEALLDHMTLNERRAMSAMTSPRDRIRALTTIWCVKEAYVKAIGEGVGFGLERIEVVFHEDKNSHAAVKSVLVDGRDIQESGWTVGSGYLDRGAYRWISIYEGLRPGGTDTPTVEPTVVGWKEMTSRLSLASGTENS